MLSSNCKLWWQDQFYPGWEFEIDGHYYVASIEDLEKRLLEVIEHSDRYSSDLQDQAQALDNQIDFYFSPDQYLATTYEEMDAILRRELELD